MRAESSPARDSRSILAARNSHRRYTKNRIASSSSEKGSVVLFAAASSASSAPASAGGVGVVHSRGSPGAASTSAASFASASTGAAAAAAAGVEKLPILIVAAGIEGSGHHMLAGVLDEAIASGRVARFNPWFQQLGGDIDGDYDRDAVRAEVLRASEPLRSTSDRAAVFYLDPSYPYSDPARNQPRHALQTYPRC